MKYLIFSDIHSNLEAFEKMLSLKKVKEVDKYLFLGDLVGYGADPNKTIELFNGLENKHSIRG
ncbi:MAG: metallophosphoesterase, partial [bacterium]|nr:metallophosphoesterase [bacterium]